MHDKCPMPIEHVLTTNTYLPTAILHNARIPQYHNTAIPLFLFLLHRHPLFIHNSPIPCLPHSHNTRPMAPLHRFGITHYSNLDVVEKKNYQSSSPHMVCIAKLVAFVWLALWPPTWLGQIQTSIPELSSRKSFRLYQLCWNGTMWLDVWLVGLSPGFNVGAVENQMIFSKLKCDYFTTVFSLRPILTSTGFR